MLTFAKFIELQPSGHSAGEQQTGLYVAYFNWFLNTSGHPISESSTEKHPEIEPESLFIHLLIQLKIIEEYCKDVNSPILTENDQTIVEYKNAIQPIINGWLHDMDQAACSHVRSAINADIAKRNYIRLSLCALIFAASVTLSVLAFIDMIPVVFAFSIIPGFILFLSGCLGGLSIEPIIEFDVLRASYGNSSALPEYDGDAAEFSLKHMAVVAYTKSEDCKNEIKVFGTKIAEKFTTLDFGGGQVIEGLSTKVITQRYSRKYTTFTTDFIAYGSQMLKGYNGKAMLDLRN